MILYSEALYLYIHSIVHDKVLKYSSMFQYAITKIMMYVDSAFPAQQEMHNVIISVSNSTVYIIVSTNESESCVLCYYVIVLCYSQ